MAYVKTVWETGDTITAEKLNHAEDGIEQADAKELPAIDTDQVILPALLVATWNDDYEVEKAWVNRHDLIPIGTQVSTHLRLMRFGVFCVCSVEGAQIAEISIPVGYRPIVNTKAFLVCQKGTGLERRLYGVSVNENGVCLADSAESALVETESLYGFIIWQCGVIDN